MTYTYCIVEGYSLITIKVYRGAYVPQIGIQMAIVFQFLLAGCLNE